MGISTTKQLNISIGKMKYKYLFFFSSYFLFITYTIFSTSFYALYIEGYWKYVFLTCAVLLAAHELLFGKYSKANFIQLIIIALLFVIVVRVAAGPGQNSIAMMFIYAFCARDIKFDRIAKFTVVVSLIALFTIVASAYIGIIMNYVEFTEKRSRVYLGFTYSLFGPAIVGNIIALIVYIKKEKMNWFWFVTMFALNLFFFFKTNSRLSFILTSALLIIAIMIRGKIGALTKRKIISACMVMSFIIGAMISLMMTLLYNPSYGWMSALDKLLGGRLMLGKSSLKDYGVSLFGNKNLALTGNGLDVYGRKSTNIYNYVDSFYIQILQRFGIVFFILLLIITTYVLYKCYKRREIYMLGIMTFIAAHCIIDDLLIYPYYNTFWIAFIWLIGGREQTCSESEDLEVQSG